MTVGRKDEGVREAEIAVELDPLSMFARCNLSGWYYGNKQYADARAESNRILDLNPHWLPAIDMLRRVAAREGRFNDAIAEARRQWQLVDSLIVPEGMNYQDFLQWEARNMETLLGKGRIKASDLAINYAEQGDKDNALKWLQKAEQRDETMPLILFYPDFDSLRDDPRFEKFVANKHLPVSAYCEMPTGTF